MFKRIAAISFIFLCSSLAWAVLGTTIFSRTYNADSWLSGRVASTWGAPQEQSSPRISFDTEETRTVEIAVNGKKEQREEKQTVSHAVQPDGSRISVEFHLDPRQKGLLWFSTYRVQFAGEYAFRNPASQEQVFHFRLPFPAAKAVYDDVALALNERPLAVTIKGSEAWAEGRLPAGAERVLRARYRSQGLDTWKYKLGEEVSQVRDFHLRAVTDFSGFDFPDNSLSPTEKRETPKGWELDWNYQNLVSGFQIALKMPQKLQPGPLAGRISYFAPVSLFFFFFVIFITTTLREIEFHPMNYFFLACAFFSFHLLLAYLADHISIHAAFAVCSIVSIALVVSYLRLVVNVRFALLEAGLSQLIYLILFSYAFFFEGFTGLTITIGAIVTLFVAMQMTGRIRWREKLERKLA